MKYKVGDKVRIKSKEWWDAQPKTVLGNVMLNNIPFFEEMTRLCGNEVVISKVYEHGYNIKGFGSFWTDEMFEGLVLDNAEKSILSEEMIKDIAEVVKKYNLGVCVSENEGKLIIEPLKVEKEEDLPIDTPCMCSDLKTNWQLRYYAGNGKVYSAIGKMSEKVHHKYTIPFDKFNPNNIEESLKYNIIKQ